jgi:hypothetical protein
MESLNTVWSLKKIASAIQKNITGAIGNVNFGYSMEQIKYMINTRRATILKEISISKSELDFLNKLKQSITCIELDCQNIERCCHVKGFETAKHFRIPRLSNAIADPVLYLGTPNRMKPFKVFYDTTFAYHQYSLKTSHRPYAWVDTSILATTLFEPTEYINTEFESSGIFYDVFLFNPPTENIKYLTIEAIFENPLDVNFFNCSKICDDDTYPAPEFIVDKIITSITQEFLGYYRKANVPQVLQGNIQGNLVTG